VTTALLYHELQRLGRPVADAHPGYVRYVIDESRFARQMAWIESAGLRGVSVGQARQAAFDAPHEVAITFDDGCESDWVIAAPRLLERGFGATFYVVSGWVGRRAGFLSAAQLRELASAGFEVGSHSATHAFLSDLDATVLRRELLESKRDIEDTIGQAVTHLSCPGGRTNRRVAEAAREAGYETMAASRVGANGAYTDPFALARCPMLRDTTQRTFEAFCRGNGLAALQLRDRALGAAKTLLGTRLYASIRNAALKP
jgi:peptidoglycan/xylan/chitin deacetylase (PgdA/CDA1 family)